MHTSSSAAAWRAPWLLIGWLIVACPLTLKAEQWQAYPSDLPTFNFDGDRLKQQWDLLQRGTVQQYPRAIGWRRNWLIPGYARPR